MDGIRTCRKCKEIKPITEFASQRSKGQERPRPYCKSCTRKMSQEWREKTPPDIQRAIRLKANHGITVEEFQETLALQGGRCAICLEEFLDKRTEVDHNHKTGQFRGILCRSCNTILGDYKDDPELLRAKGYDEAAWYIERANEKYDS